MPSDMHQFLSFHVGEVECAVELSLVHEVIRCAGITRFAGFEDTFAGAIHRHGEFVPVVDLHQQGIRPTPPIDSDARVLVLDAAGYEVGALVDHLGEIIHLASPAMQPLPHWMSTTTAPYFKGLGAVDGRWLLILAPSQLLPKPMGSPDASLWLIPVPSQEAEHQECQEAAVHPQRTWRQKVPQPAQDALEQEVQLQSTLNARSLEELEEMAKAMSEGDFHRQVSSKVQGELENLAAYIAKTMSNLQLLDPSVRISAERDIPAASQQLSDVVKATEEAANTIISLTETLLDHQGALGEAIDRLKRQKYRSRDHQDIIAQLEHLHWEDEKTLIEIITNLSFQDLTGQRINKIVTMVTAVQDKLCDLIQAFGIKVEAPPAEAPVQELPSEPPEEEAGKLAQDSVDSLLNQLFN